MSAGSASTLPDGGFPFLNSEQLETTIVCNNYVYNTC